MPLKQFKLRTKLTKDAIAAMTKRTGASEIVPRIAKPIPTKPDSMPSG
jgi:hypothetical protein